MASAESGRGAILSTHKHGQQLRELFTPRKDPHRTQPWPRAPVRTYRHRFRVPAAKAAPPLDALNSPGRPDASPQTISLARETRMAQKG